MIAGLDILGDKEALMNSQALFDCCVQFNPGKSNEFKGLVAGYLQLSGTAQKDLARDCEVAISTVSRWARGASCPGVNVQKLVVAKIRRRVRPKPVTGSIVQAPPVPMAAKSGG